MLTKQQRESLSDAKLLCETATAMQSSVQPILMGKGQGVVHRPDNVGIVADNITFLLNKALIAIKKAFPDET